MVETVISLNHITLAVSNIDVSFLFYRDVVGLKPLCRWDKGAYFLAGDFWFCLNVDPKVQPDAGYTHYAFSVTEQNFNLVRERILQTGARIFQENTSEGDSLYFCDPDGHKLEIHVGDVYSRLDAKKREPGKWRELEWFV